MWPIVGHESALARLKRSLETGNLGHAYLISGPTHVGKMTVALTLAQALNCRSSDSPCGTCSQCLRIMALSHPDVQVVTLGSAVSEEDRSHSEIGIDQIRNDIQHWASLPPFEGGVPCLHYRGSRTSVCRSCQLYVENSRGATGKGSIYFAGV